MIKEELKQNAEKSLDKRLGTYAYIRKQDCYTNYVDGYIDGAEFGYNKANKELQKAKQIIQEFLDLNYSEFTKTNAVFLHADKFLKESK